MTAYGEYIPMFGLEHFLYILILALCGILLFKGKDIFRKHEKIFTAVLLITSIFQQVILYSSYYYFFDFDLGESLPLHISRINSILIIIFLITKSRKLFGIICYLSLFAWLTFLYPSRVYGMNHPIGLSFILNHVITLLFPFYGRLVYRMKVRAGDKLATYKWFIVYLIVVAIINPLVDGNYFYFKYKPIIPTLPNTIYIPLVLVIAYVLFNIGEYFYLRWEKNSE